MLPPAPSHKPQAYAVAWRLGYAGRFSQASDKPLKNKFTWVSPIWQALPAVFDRLYKTCEAIKPRIRRFAPAAGRLGDASRYSLIVCFLLFC